MYDRKAQLEELAAATGELLAFMLAEGVYLEWVPALEAVYSACERMRIATYSQDDLSTLGRSFPRFINFGKGFDPPLERSPRAAWYVPAWFDELERRFERASNAAFALRVVQDS